MPSKPHIRLLVADDHEMVRLGVKSLLAGTEIEVVAEASTGQAAVKLALAKQVDLVLLDVRMPDGDGLAALGCIKLDKPDLPVLLFSAFDNLANFGRAITLGANGFLLKGCTREELLNAIRRVAAGKTVGGRGKLGGVTRAMRTPRVGTLEASLNERQGKVLRQIAYGRTNEQIAKALNTDCDAVKQLVKHVLRKLGLTDRTQAAVWAIRNDLA